MSPQTLGKIFTWMPLKGSTPTMTLNQMTAGTALRHNLSIMLRPALRSVVVAPNKATSSLHSIHRHSKQPSELCQFLPHTMQAMTTKTAFLLHPPHPQDSITRPLPGNFSTTLRQLRLLHWPSTTSMPLWLSMTPRLCRPTVCFTKPTRPMLITRCQFNLGNWSSVRNPPRNPSSPSPTIRAPVPASVHSQATPSSNPIFPNPAHPS